MIFLCHLKGLQDPITQDMLVDDGLVFDFQQRFKRGLGGGPTTIELQIKNPGLVILSRSQYVAVVDCPTGLLADATVLGRARMTRCPDDLGDRDLTIRLMMECAPASWKDDLRQQANQLVSGAGIAAYQVPIIPDPGAGVIAVAFAGSPSATWDSIKAGAIAVESFFQDDLTRSPYSSFMNYQTLSIPNAVLTVTVPDGPAVRAAARFNHSVIIAVSGDKDPTHGVPRAAGLVTAIRPSPGGNVDVIINMAGQNLVTAGIAPATPPDPTSAGLPYFEPLIPGPQSDLSTAVLEGRSQVWSIDPVTHVTTLDDTIHGVFVDLAPGGVDLGFADSEQQICVDRPVKSVKAKLVAEFTQNAYGPVDLAPLVNQAGSGGGSILSLTAGVGGVPQSQTGGDINIGWGQSGSKIDVQQGLSPGLFFTGRTFELQTRVDTMSWVVSTDQYNVTTINSFWSIGPVETTTHAEYAQAVVNSLTYRQWLWTYNWSQSRREVVDLVLDIEHQPFALCEDTLDLGTIQVNDVNTLGGIPPYADGTVYNTGDRVLNRGHLLECMADRVITLYSPVTVKRNGFPETNFVLKYWRDLGVQTPMGDPRTPSYFDGQRGQGTIQAVLLRMRAAGLKRLSALRYRKTFPWSVAKGITTQNEVRMLFRDGDTVIPVRGKVEEVTRHVYGGEGASPGGAEVTITISPCVGTARNDIVEAVPPRYVSDGYVESTYTGASKPLYVSDVQDGYVRTGSVGQDIEYVLTANPLYIPVDAFKLGDPGYSCLSVTLKNDGFEQLGQISACVAAGLPPSQIGQLAPTTLDIGMRPLRSEGLIIRNYVVHAALTVSPRGIDLANGGEP